VSVELPAGSPRLIDASDGEVMSAARLDAQLSPARKWLDALGPGLVVLLCRNTVPEVLMLIAALRSGRPVMLLDGRAWSGKTDGLARAYRPAAVAAVDGAALPEGPGRRRVRVGGLEAVEEPRGSAAAVHDALALCLMTSGSQGAPKCVRLSRTNLRHNWTAVAARLGIDASQRTPTSLSLAHSYGLSVLGSHLVAGAGVLVTSNGPLSPAFWPAVARSRITSLAAVPYQYRKLVRLPRFREFLGRLDYATVAGGALDRPTAQRVSSIVGAGRGRGGLWLMYGQTEATARIAMHAPEDLAAVGPAAGRVIEGGSVRILDGAGRECEPGTAGEIVYRGPGVMMGYAADAAGLSRGAEVEALYTADRGFVDGDGFLHVVGRASGWVKVAGQRISLESVEALAAAHRAVLDAAACCDPGTDEITLALEISGPAAPSGPGHSPVRDLHREVCAATGLPPDCVTLRVVDRLPRLASGKVDRARLIGLATRSGRAGEGRS
jgi:acyl-coenzyme A synthetase/AMP-(fatty) acid ligase